MVLSLRLVRSQFFDRCRISTKYIENQRSAHLIAPKRCAITTEYFLGCDMNTRWALGLALLILGIFALDHFYLEWNLPVILGTLLVRVLDWMAIWR